MLSTFAWSRGDADGIIVVGIRVVWLTDQGQAMARVFFLASWICAIVVVAGFIACRMATVVGVVCLLFFHRFLLICRVCWALLSCVLCRTVRMTVQPARGAAVALHLASRLWLLVKWLTVAFGIQALLVAVSLQRFALRSTMVVVAIVLMAIDVVALSIFATRNLTLSAIGAAIVQLLRTLQRRSSDTLWRRRFLRCSTSWRLSEPLSFFCL